MDDDDDFLYGDAPTGPPKDKQPPPSEPISGLSTPESYNNVALPGTNETKAQSSAGQPPAVAEPIGEEDDDEEEMEEDSEDDIEIITENTPAVPLDFKTAVNRSSANVPPPPTQPKPSTSSNIRTVMHPVHLTTEYTPRERGEPPSGLAARKPQPPPVSSTPVQVTTSTGTPSQSTFALQTIGDSTSQHAPSTIDDEPQADPKTLPPVRALSSAPALNLEAPGTMVDGRSVYEIDINSLENKAWRRPGSDLSDWFNYGFDEISWEAYCNRRELMGDMADKLKVNLLNFSNLTEEQLMNAPDVRKTAILGANLAAMNQGQPPQAMVVGPGPGPNADMGGMGMPMGPMGMGGMAMPGGPGMVPGGDMQMMQGMDMNVPGDGTPMGPNMGVGMGMDFGGPGNVGMGMDYMDPSMGGGAPQFGMDGGQVGPGGVNVPVGPSGAQMGGPVGRGAFRGTPRGIPPAGPAAANRGIRGGFRARGRGIAPPTGPAGFEGVTPPTGPAAMMGGGRAASPLPPNVPTGPRSQHRYKDRDTGNVGGAGNEQLDYGGGGDGGGSGRESRYDKDDDSRDGRERSSRKRRGSAGDDSGRSKRR